MGGAFDIFTVGHMLWGVSARYAIPGGRVFSFVAANLLHVATEWHELDKYPTPFGSSTKETDGNHIGDQIAFALGWAIAELAAEFHYVSPPKLYTRACLVFWGTFVFELAVECLARWKVWHQPA